MNDVTAKLGQVVTYVGSAGTQKAAMVVGTAESVRPGTDVPALEGNEVHLTVFSVTGTVYMRHNVPNGPFTTPAGDEVTTGVWFA